jgi:hypothetical protein
MKTLRVRVKVSLIEIFFKSTGSFISLNGNLITNPKDIDENLSQTTSLKKWEKISSLFFLFVIY